MMRLVGFIFLIPLILAAACARQSAPTGGPKDTIPPVLEAAIPRNETTNFSAREVELVFSEQVILNAPKEQIIITPGIGKDYEISVRKNVVRLELTTPLQDSTTYTFNFREAVQDITEKNPVRNLSVAYSTGTYIDSLSVEGMVYEMLTGTPVKDATVALHVENDTFNIFEDEAQYFTRTDKNGKYLISHLKADNYFPYAFQDKNRNLVVNSRSESYGYQREYLYLFEDVTNINIGLVSLDASPLKITAARPYNTYFNIRTNKNLRTFDITATDSSDVVSTFGEDQANIRIYRANEQDSTQIRLTAIDSIGNRIDTVLFYKFQSREATPEAFDVKLEDPRLLTHKGSIQAKVQFTKPVDNINFDSIYFQVDSLTRVNISSTDVRWDPAQRTLAIEASFDKSYYPRPDNLRTSRTPSRAALAQKQPVDGTKTFINELHLGRGAFISVEGDTSRAIVQAVTPQSQEQLATISLGARTTEPEFIIQLLDNSFNLVQQITNKRQVKFEDVEPGQYMIRLIIDRNANGRWDAGNYYQRIEPEPIIYYRNADGSTIIKGVNANWDIGEGEMFINY